MFRHNGRVAVAIVASVMAAGCATAPAAPRWEGMPADGAQIQLTVDNRVFHDVVIYSQTQGSRVRLGTVSGGFNATFKIPPHQRMSSSLRLVADPIGSPHAWTSEPISVTPGSEIRWTVHENRGVRTLTVWAR